MTESHEPFDPYRERSRCEKYLSRALTSPVRLICAERLTQSTRHAPWRLDVAQGGTQLSYVLRLDARNGEHEYEVLKAMESVPVPTPRVYGWDPEGEALGMPCFLCDFIEGESLLDPMLAGEPWAEELYIDTACRLQSISREQVAGVARRFGWGMTAAHFLEEAYAYFQSNPHELADAVYARLKDTLPPLPEVQFSNGDLWPDNMLIRDQELVGVIDFEHSGFTDPVFEFLLPFFVEPELRGRGIEERYCQRQGHDPDMLPWYHALEYFDTWHWVLQTGRPFVQYSADVLEVWLRNWLEEV